MVKLTAELIQNSMQYINPVKDRELDLRGELTREISRLCNSYFRLIKAIEYQKLKIWELPAISLIQ